MVTFKPTNGSVQTATRIMRGSKSSSQLHSKNSSYYNLQFLRPQVNVVPNNESGPELSEDEEY